MSDAGGIRPQGQRGDEGNLSRNRPIWMTNKNPTRARWYGEHMREIRCDEVMLAALPVGQLHLIKPRVIVGHVLVAVHLERNVDFRGGTALRCISPVDVVLSAVERDGDELDITAAGALELPNQVVPFVGSRLRTTNARVHPL